MSRWVRVLELVLVMSLAGARVAPAQSVGRSSPSFVLRVHGTEHVDPTALRAAREVVEWVYREAGIDVEWRPQEVAAPEMPAGPCLFVLIRSLEEGSTLGTRRDVLGAAPGTPTSRGALAYVFYQRVEAFARANRLHVGHVLGYVIAHELGHLLLPHGSHSSSGLMRRTLLAADVRQAVTLPRFDELQAAQMHSRLAGAALRFARR